MTNVSPTRDLYLAFCVDVQVGRQSTGYALFSMRKQCKDKTNKVPVWTGTKVKQKEEKSINSASKEQAQVNLAMLQNNNRINQISEKKINKTILQLGSLKIQVLLTRMLP